MASLANVLGPLLQQPGMQNLNSLNLGSLLSQGFQGNIPQQQQQALLPQALASHPQMQTQLQVRQQFEMGKVCTHHHTR